jgi:quercetin dioxygenase-like cupin family protein
MPRVIAQPSRINAHGDPPKVIEEYIGSVNSSTPELSIARMISPGGWREPGQTPEFTEYTVVLRGMLRIETHGGVHDVNAGQAVVVEPG